MYKIVGELFSYDEIMPKLGYGLGEGFKLMQLFKKMG